MRHIVLGLIDAVSRKLLNSAYWFLGDEVEKAVLRVAIDLIFRVERARLGEEDRFERHGEVFIESEMGLNAFNVSSSCVTVLANTGKQLIII